MKTDQTDHTAHIHPNMFDGQMPDRFWSRTVRQTYLLNMRARLRSGVGPYRWLGKARATHGSDGDDTNRDVRQSNEHGEDHKTGIGSVRLGAQMYK